MKPRVDADSLMRALRLLLLLLAASFAAPTLANFNVQGMWWKSPANSESGWGLNISHQGDILFATWFTYDTDGSPLWLVMPRTARYGQNAYGGRIYRTTGPAHNAATWSSAAVNATDVGSVTLRFTDANNGTFEFTVNGTSRTKTITRQSFSTMPVCAQDASPDWPANLQDMWWADPPESESGWGVNVTHQGDIVFATWFTYDATGKGIWYVVPRADRAGMGNTFVGDLYRTTGPAYSAESWNAGQVTATPVGTATFAFSSHDRGTFTYTLDSGPRTKNITRQVYASPKTVCRAPGDARNGEYKLFSADFNQYALGVNFDQRRWEILGPFNGDDLSGVVTGGANGTYGFEFAPNNLPEGGSFARFRTADGLIAGFHPRFSGAPSAFIAARRFVTSPLEIPLVNMWLFSSDVQLSSSPRVNSRVMAIRLEGSRIHYCAVASGALTTVANCQPGNLSIYPLIFNANGSVTWLDNGVPVDMHIARSGNELVVIRAQGYPQTTGNQRFQLALEDGKSALAGMYVGPATSGSWGTINIDPTSFARSAATASNVSDGLFGTHLSAGSAAMPLRAFSGNDNVQYFMLRTGVLSAYLAGRGSAKAGTIGFGLAP